MSPADLQQLIDFTYIAAAIGFILAIKWLGSPVTAKRGVIIGELASAIAVIATLCDPQVEPTTSGSSSRSSSAPPLAYPSAW